MKKFFTILLLFFLYQIPIFSQHQIIFQKEHNEAFLVRNSNELNYTGKEILRKISRSINKPLYNTQFTFSYKEKLKLLKLNGKVEFIVELGNLKLSGDYMYRKFSLKKALIPKEVSFTIIWKSKKHKKILGKFQKNNIKLKEEYGRFQIANFQAIDTTRRKKSIFKVKNKRFIYTQRNLKIFNKRIQLINKYYKISEEINKAISKLDNFNLNKLGQLSNYRNTISNNENLILRSKRENFYKKLKLNKKDPADFNRLLALLEIRNREMQNKITETITNLYKIYYEKGMNSIARGNLIKAEKQFLKSIQNKPLFAPSHYQLAEIYFIRNDYRTSGEKLKEIFARMYPDVKTGDLALRLGHKIYIHYLKEAEFSNNRSQFDRAIIEIRNAEDICRNIPNLACTPEIENQYSLSYTGKYNALLRNAKKLTQERSFNKANSFCNRIFEFQRNNSRYIKDNFELMSIFQKIYNGFIQEGNNYNKNRKFEQAISQFKLAENLCSKYETVNCTENINKGIFTAKTGIYSQMLNNADFACKQNNIEKAENLITKANNYCSFNNLRKESRADYIFLNIKQKKYDNLIKQAEKENQRNKYANSLNLLDKAKEIENTYKIKQNFKLDNLINKNANLFCLKKIKLGILEAEKNNLDRARYLYSESSKVIQFYKLNNSETLKIAAELKAKIFTQECNNLQNEYNTKYRQAIDLIIDKQFERAYNLLFEAIQITSKIPDCGISAETANTKRKEILPVVTYKKKKNEVRQKVNYRAFSEAINLYLEAGKHFISNNLDKFNISHAPLFEFISNSNSEFINYGVNYFLNSYELDNSLQLLEILFSRSYPASRTKEQQTKLGEQLAIADFQQNPNANMKENFRNYTQKRTWFRFLKRAYKKKWKQLK